MVGVITSPPFSFAPKMGLKFPVAKRTPQPNGSGEAFFVKPYLAVVASIEEVVDV